MLRKFAAFHVPKSFYFPNPENNFRIQGRNLQDLASKVRLYRAQNEFPELEFLEAVIEHYLCGRPENIGACEDRGPLKRGIIATIKGAVVVLKNLMYNSFTSQAVADARSEICKDCSLNIAPDMGPFIEWSNRVAEHSIGDRKSKYHDSLYICEGCGCPLKSKCWYAGEITLSAEEKTKMKTANAKCWQVLI